MLMLSNIFWLGTKELRSFLHDFVLVGFVVDAFSLAVIAQAQSNSQELHNASIAYVDEDHSELSRRIVRAFLPPYFQTPQRSPSAISPADERLEIYLRAGHPSELRTVCSRWPQPGDPAQRRRNRDGAGRARRRLCPADHHTEIQDFFRTPRPAAVAGQSRRAHRFQSQRDDGVVRQRHGDHQQRLDAGDRPGRRRDRPRARARHHGPSPGHAADAVRDCDVQGLGERPRHHRCGRPFALFRRPHPARHSHRRLDPAVHGRRGHLSVLRPAIGIFLGTVARSMPHSACSTCWSTCR